MFKEKISPKLGKSELRFISSVCCIIELGICVKFHQNISNSCQLTERTLVHCRNGYFQYLQCSKGCNPKGRLTKVMVLIFYRSSDSALHLQETLWKYLKRFSTYRVDRNTWWKCVQCSKGNNSKN